MPGSTRPRGELRIPRREAQRLLPCQGLLADRVPAGVEPALVFRDPVGRGVVRRMRGARRVIDEERLVGRRAALRPDPADRLVGQIAVEDVVRIADRRLDRRGVLVERRGPLVGVALHEAVEVLEAEPGRPAIERPARSQFPQRRDMRLAEHARGIAGIGQQPRARRRRLGDDAGIAVEPGRGIGHVGDVHGMVIAPGQQRGARRRADAGRGEGAVAQAVLRHGIEGRRVDRAAEGGRRAVADVIGQDQQHARRVGGRPGELRPDTGLSCERSGRLGGSAQGCRGDADGSGTAARRDDEP